MKTRAYYLSTKVVIRNGRGQVLVLRRSAASRNHPGLWEFPGGKTDAGESFDEALLREVQEETGVEIVLEHVAGAGSSELDGKTIAYLFMEARLVAGEVRLSEEHDAFRWVELDELLALDLCPQFRRFAEEHARSRGFSAAPKAAPPATDGKGGSDPLDGWVRDFRQLQPAYERLAARAQQVLKSRLGRCYTGLIVEARAKEVASFAEKIVRKRKYSDPLRQITDLCGVRVIAQIRSEMEEVCAFIRRHFIIDEANSMDTLSRLQNAEFGYRSVHFVAQFRAGEFPEVEADLLPLKMEIQVRTVVEHAWASVAHDRLYKTGFKVPDHWQRESARQAAALESANDAFQRMVTGLEEYHSHFGAYLTPAQIRDEMAVCEAVLRHEPGNARQAARRARLALSIGDWDAVERTAAAFPEELEKPAELLLCLGTALCQRQPDAGKATAELERGRALLKEAARLMPEDTEALLRLAETADVPHERLRHLTDAFALAPGDPEVLCAYVRQKIAVESSTAFLPLLRPSIQAAMRRCEQHIDAQVNLPLAHYQMAFFHLLLGDATGTATEALECCVLAVRHTHAVAFLDSALRACAELRDCLVPARRDLECVFRFLLVAHRALFPDAPLPANMAAPPAKPLPQDRGAPVLILAGGCSSQVTPYLPAFRAVLAAGLRDFQGTVLCGGTREGVSGLVGELFGQDSGHPGAHVVGYLPGGMPPDGTATADSRCHELRSTDDKDSFSILEPLQAWLDILATGIPPAEVRLLGMNGGHIAGLEYRIAWALGARTGILQDSGREADRLQALIREGAFPGMLLLPQDAMTVRAFVRGPSQGSLLLDDSVRERLARLVHAQFLADNRYRNPDPAMQPWEALRADLRQSNLDQVEYMAQILAAGGFGIAPLDTDFADSGFTEEEIERMAEMEHGRWNVERLRQQWQWHPQRDPARKHSPWLLAWEKLPGDIRRYDRDNVRSFPRRLAEIGLQVVRRIK